MARGVYSGKVSEWSTTSWKPMSSALIGLVPEPSHDLRECVRSRTGSDWTGGTYTTLTHGGSVRKPFGRRRWHMNWPDVLPVFNGDQSTRVLSTVWDLLFTIRITSQVDNLSWRLVLLVFARNVDSCRHHRKDWRRRHRRSHIRQPRRSRNDGSFVISILGTIPSA